MAAAAPAVELRPPHERASARILRIVAKGPVNLILAGLIPKLLGSRLLLDVHDFSPLMFDVRFHGRPGAGAATKVLTRLQTLAGRIAGSASTEAPVEITPIPRAERSLAGLLKSGKRPQNA